MINRERAADGLQIVFEGAPNGVMAIDAAGCITMVNAPLAKIFGYSREELIGLPVEVLVPERFRHGHTNRRKEFCVKPQTRLMGTGGDLLGVRKDGSEFPVEVGLNSAAVGMGGVVVATVVDITGRKRVAEEESLLERARGKLEVCQQLGMPAAVLRCDGQVLLLNALLSELHSQFVLKGCHIELSNPAANASFLQALGCLDCSNGDEIVRSIPVPAADDYPPLVFHLLPMKGSFGSTLGVLVVTTLSGLSMPPAELAQRLFALAPAEAKVATLIGAGLSPRDTAEQLGISEGTARTTLQHVFSKVGVSRQNELATLLTKLTLR